MQSDAYHDLRIASENQADPPASHRVRRFAGIFPQISETVSADCGDATYEGRASDSDNSDPSQWEFVSVVNVDASTTQIPPVAGVDESSTLSAAQQIIACYRAVHGSDHMFESATTDIQEKELPQIPEDQRSMYTLATPADTQSTMDMMWKPKPKVHMRRTDQCALIQAQTQAIAMMHDAGLKPTNRIQCRRRGCADILSGVEALKYHLHIHNIADAASRCEDVSPSAVHKPSLIESNSKTSKRGHDRSKSSLSTRHSRPTTYSPPRKLSSGCPLPSLFSPRETTPEVQHIPTLTTVATALVSDPSPGKPVVPLLICNNLLPCTRASTHSRDRITRKEGKATSADTECDPRIAMLLTPPASPDVQGCQMPPPHTNSSVPSEVDLVADGENDGRVFDPCENAHPAPEKLTRSRSPARSLSPMRAMSPIRDSIRRVLAIGYSVDFTDK